MVEQPDPRGTRRQMGEEIGVIGLVDALVAEEIEVAEQGQEPLSQSVLQHMKAFAPLPAGLVDPSRALAFAGGIQGLASSLPIGPALFIHQQAVLLELHLGRGTLAGEIELDALSVLG